MSNDILEKLKLEIEKLLNRVKYENVAFMAVAYDAEKLDSFQLFGTMCLPCAAEIINSFIEDNNIPHSGELHPQVLKFSDIKH